METLELLHCRIKRLEQAFFCRKSKAHQKGPAGFGQLAQLAFTQYLRGDFSGRTFRLQAFDINAEAQIAALAGGDGNCASLLWEMEPTMPGGQMGAWSSPRPGITAGPPARRRASRAQACPATNSAFRRGAARAGAGIEGSIKGLLAE
ncbi:Uncharacterised protein [Brucella melitensis]|nr:hypothetical protein DK61_2551 [Brucella melitensis bv. 2 str. 63/9]ENQ88949.1 hypothetical protein C004_02144 [Brucella melitensis F6/05-6]SPU61158.1 Uncharacterised protein [Brucella melitensis]